MTVIAALPTAPTRNQTDSAFATTADAFLAALVTFATQLETARLEVNTNNTTAQSAATTAAASAGATLWVSGQTVTQWTDERISPINGQTYRRKSATGSGTTDPSADPTNYVRISFGSIDSPIITTPQIVGVRTTKVAFTGATPTLDLSTGDLFTGTISAPTTFALSNAPATGIVCVFDIELVNGGSQTITWWSGIQWDGGVAPTGANGGLSTSGKDRLSFYSYDGGVTWVGAVCEQGIA